MKRTISIILGLLPLCILAQVKPIGSWSDHLPYNEGKSLTSDGVTIFAATSSGLFTYNTKDNSINKFSKVNLLNDVDIRKTAYSIEFKTLIIVYDNGNIDLLTENKITNIPFIKLSNQKKNINEINIIGSFAYLSTDFGISVVDIVKKEIVDSYKFGPNGSDILVNTTSTFNEKIYAGTASGIYFANLTSNLLDFNNWQKLSFKANAEIKKLLEIDNQLIIISKNGGSIKDSTHIMLNSQFIIRPQLSFINFRSLEKTNNTILNTENSTYFLNEKLEIINKINHNNPQIINSIVVDNRFFIMDSYRPLTEFDTIEKRILTYIRPNGPAGKTIFDMDASQGVLWTANGGHNFAYNGTFSNAEIYNYNGFEWKSYNTFNPPSLSGKFDVLGVTSNPNNGNEAYFGSWGAGLIYYNNKFPFVTFNDTNSSLKKREALNNWVGAGEGAFDEEGNFWTTNTYQINGISVRKKDGNWKSFNLSPQINSQETAILDIVVDYNGYKWITLPKDNAIVVFDDNGTIDNTNDDRKIKLTPSTGNGSIPGGRGIKIEVDNDGLIWIGTSDGIAVHFNPGGVFDGDLDFDRIIFFDGENNEIVLQNSVVKEIAIDGFNRKWVSVENSGVILLSADGKETILDFNVENSPLLSNQINAISIDEVSGEVYMATDKGLVSYRGEAISGSKNLNQINIYPNPVRPEYKGKIAINGLLDNSTVKVTDINGTLVNEIKSQGGQVLWDGNNFTGRRVSSGIYLVLISGENEDTDLNTAVGKIMIIN